MQRLKISREGVILIKSFEGFRPHAVLRDDGGWVIGYGHTLSAREGAVVSEAEAELLLQYDLVPIAKALNQVDSPLNQHQFDALASFAFSVGLERFQSSDVLARLTSGAPRDAADAMIGWTDPQPITSPVRRRTAERALFVADPARPVGLAELLGSPLSPALTQAPSEPEGEIARDAETAQPHAVAEAFASETLSAPETAADTAAVAFADAQPTAALVGSGADAGAASPQRYSAYAAGIVGPLPGPFPANLTTTAVPVSGNQSPANDPTATPNTEPEPAPFPPAFLAETVVADGGALHVQTPLDEAGTVSTERVALSEGDSADPSALFDDRGALRPEARHMIRHEVLTEEPRKLHWREIGLYVVMAGFGLVTFGLSVAAFRTAALPTGGSDFAPIAWVLAVLGFASIAISAWNLYRKLGRHEDDKV